MIRKMLYKFQRPDGGYTVSPYKPDSQYQVRWRLFAEEGRAITNGQETVTVIDLIHRKDCDEWTDCAPPEENQIPVLEGIQ